MKRILIISLLTILFSTKSFQTFAQFDSEQQKPKKPFRERLFTGGGVIINFGSTTTNTNPPIPVSMLTLGASPILGYRITERLAAGVGATYIYYREKAKGYPAYSTNIYGGNVFSRYLVWKSLFVQAEYGFLNWEVQEIVNFHYTGNLIRVNTFSLPVGLGYQQPIGRNSFFEIMAMYDLLYYQQPYQLNSSPFIFRAGVNLGL
jgi:hypothetical protein